MFIERVEVEEGFLDGLDLHLTEGLNVLIGPRGVGKTSVVELIRYCLGVPGFTEESDKEARQHAAAVLKGGRVTLTIRQGEETVVLSRAAEEPAPRQVGSPMAIVPTVLSQKEIERVGLDAPGRLRLLDTFRGGRTQATERDKAVRSRIVSVAKEVASVASALESTRGKLDALATVDAELAAALAEESAVLQSVDAAQEQRAALTALAKGVSGLSARDDVATRSKAAVSAWQEQLALAVSLAPTLEDWPPGSDEGGGLAGISLSLDEAMSHLSSAQEAVDKMLTDLSALQQTNQAEYIDAQGKMRTLRRSLEEIKTGAGTVTRKVSDLRERASQREALLALLNTQKTDLAGLQSDRDDLLDELDGLREERYESRMEIVGHLNEQLRPRIELALTRYGLFGDYAAAIAAALRGGGVQYNVLGPVLASKLSPRELSAAAERGDAVTIAELAGISEDRAEKIVRALQSFGTGQILTATVEDSVTMRLLDGTEQKTSEEVSTGQRCTIILPIILAHPNDVLVIDQPEDHLDNAFIVDTVVKALMHLGKESQVITSTHNANIPVLGDASRVIMLGSDGARGFVKLEGDLRDSAVVEAITGVMEGGRKAFALRADFYQQQLGIIDG